MVGIFEVAAVIYGVPLFLYIVAKLVGWAEPRFRRSGTAEAPARRAVGRSATESALAGSLLAGKLSNAAYRRAMEQLAADEEAAHPTVTPPDLSNGAR